MKLLYRQLHALLCVQLTTFAPLALADDNLIPLEAIASLPAFSKPVLSPDGKHVATMMVVDGDSRIIVQELHSGGSYNGSKPAQIGVGEYQFSNYGWANNDRLLIKIRATDSIQGYLLNIQRLGTIGRDGTDPLMLPAETNDNGRYRQHANLVSRLDDDPDHILAALDDNPDGWAEPQVHKVNVYTGKRKLIEGNARGVYRWMADGNGELRIGVRYNMNLGRKRVSVLYRETENARWAELQTTDYFDHERMEPYRFDENDPNILLVTSAALKGDEMLDESAVQLYRYNLTTRQIEGEYTNQLLSDIQEMVEKALPDLDLDLVSRDSEDNLFFFRAYNDTLSPEYFLLNRNAGKFDYVAAEYPDLIKYRLAAMDKISYTARDEMEIPAFLTLPVDTKPEKLPFIIYPHGGPWAHDEWGFDNYVQFFANRGYGVLQPQFRGSTGLGIEHEEAGYGEWGYAIQDDISDGVKWLIDQGIADPDRICIVGASFGGYAAAIGLAKTPELYACGVSVNGVMDLKYFLDGAKNQLFGNLNKATWNSRSEAKEASPYHLAKQVRAPLLLIASERDTVVPAKHSKKMYKRLKSNRQSVQYEVLPDGEHWRTNEALELKKFQLIENFLAQHLAAPTEH
jgi:dipeptidyl aminopeptidase/acylaminoacyl peptidase